MEEMRGAAMAYYANMTYDQQQLLVSLYRTIDVNGDGRVSIQEFSKFIAEKGYNRHVPPNLFQLLDKNNDGTLDFEECLTFFYMVRGQRLVICDGCESYLWGLYFLCAECYRVCPAKSYDLCCSCYRNRNFSHVHSAASFLDNYALLRSLQFVDRGPGPVDGTRSRSVDYNGRAMQTNRVDYNGRAMQTNRGVGTVVIQSFMLAWNIGEFIQSCSQQ